MKIIKPGIYKNDTSALYVGKCPACKCEFTCMPSDTELVDIGGGGHHHIYVRKAVCPECRESTQLSIQ